MFQKIFMSSFVWFELIDIYLSIKLLPVFLAFGNQFRICSHAPTRKSIHKLVENARDFTDWAQEYGYDPDSRRAERTFNTVKRQSKGLRRLVGHAAFNELLWETERL